MTPDIELLDLFLQLDERQGLQYAFISIRPNSRIINPQSAAVPPVILEAVNRELERHEIKHGIRPREEIMGEIERYLAEYEKINAGKTFFTFLVAEPTLPQKGDDGSLEVLIDLKLKPGKIKDKRTGRIDYHDLGFSETLVHVGDPLVIIRHATPGTDGTDIFGEIIPAQPGREEKIPSFNRNTIALVEDPENRQSLLKALISGFFYHDTDRGYFIDKDVLTQRVDFSTGNIEVQDFSEIDTIIKVSGNKDILIDSVKPGFTLKAKEIIIDGNVGRGATLEGEKIVISGIVDAKARISGRQIEINKAVGAFIEGERIKINAVLQNAEVCGHEIAINTCVSSRIRGEEIFVSDELRAGSLTAARFIYCRRATGSNHATLRIDPPAIPSFLAKLEELRERVGLLEEEDSANRKRIEKLLEAHHRRHQAHLENFHQQLEEAKKISINEHQKRAIEQLIAQGNLELVSEKLKFKLNPITRQQLEEFAAGLQEINEEREEFEELSGMFEKERKRLQDLETAHIRGLILISDESSAEMKICYLETCLPPVVFNQKLLFCFDGNRGRITALKKFGAVTHQRLFSHLTPRALAVVNKLI